MNKQSRLITIGAVAGALIVAAVLLNPQFRAQRYDGIELYLANCSACHGVYGEGDGAVTPSLSVVLLDLRYITQRNGGEFPTAFITEIIDGRAQRAAHGPVDMPAWGAAFTQQEGYDPAAQARVAGKIEALVDFLESIQIED